MINTSKHEAETTARAENPLRTLLHTRPVVGVRPGTYEDTSATELRLGLFRPDYDPKQVITSFIAKACLEEEFKGANAMRRHLENRLNGRELAKFAAYINQIVDYQLIDNPLKANIVNATVMHELDLLPAHCKFFDENYASRQNSGFNPSKIMAIAFRAAYISDFYGQNNPHYKRMAQEVHRALQSLEYDTIMEAANRGGSGLAYHSQLDDLAFRNLDKHPEAAAKWLEQGIVGTLVYNNYYRQTSRVTNGLASLQREYRQAQVPFKTMAGIIDYGIGVVGTSQDFRVKEAFDRVLTEIEKAQDHMETEGLAKWLVWDGPNSSKYFM